MPEGIDGRNLLPLLTRPQGRVRDVLPLFNFWGTMSAQSMAVVTPEWKYVYWYYGGDGMAPTEELFHVGRDRFEMATLAKDRGYAKELAAMRQNYDAELAAIKAKVVKGHGYEIYPTLFDRNIPQDAKAPLLKKAKHQGGSDGGSRKRKKKKTAK